MRANRKQIVLMIAYHFPPLQGSSGIQRTLRFAQHLPRFGWHPIVLTINPTAYESQSESRGNELPDGVEIVRAFGLDAARQLSVFGRYPRRLALPDRWATWRLDAVRRASQIIRKSGVDVVWSTFPIASAHTIGLELARRSGLPWIAEFRDPMWQGDFPPDPAVNRCWRTLEAATFGQAEAVAVTTPGAAVLYAERFPTFPADRLVLIENGYDEETFQRAESILAPRSRPTLGSSDYVTLLHSGIIYRSERDPTEFFAAVASLKSKGLIIAGRHRIVLRASGDDGSFDRELKALGITDIVRLEPPIDYLLALQEMLMADGLLLLQASNCNAQVPAKLYEYLRAGRPILALTDPAGDTARMLAAAGAGLIARLDSRSEIESALVQFLEQLDKGTGRSARNEVVVGCSRLARTAQLAQLLDRVSAAG